MIPKVHLEKVYGVGCEQKENQNIQRNRTGILHKMKYLMLPHLTHLVSSLPYLVIPKMKVSL